MVSKRSSTRDQGGKEAGCTLEKFRATQDAPQSRIQISFLSCHKCPGAGQTMSRWLYARACALPCSSLCAPMLELVRSYARAWRSRSLDVYRYPCRRLASFPMPPRRTPPANPPYTALNCAALKAAKEPLARTGAMADRLYISSSRRWSTVPGTP